MAVKVGAAACVKSGLAASVNVIEMSFHEAGTEKIGQMGYG